MNIVAFPVARRARQEAVKLAHAFGLGKYATRAMAAMAAKRAEAGVLPILAARGLVQPQAKVRA